jgi:cellulose synthase operon protein C
VRKPKTPDPERLTFPQFPVRKPEQAEPDRVTSPLLAGRPVDALEPTPLVHSQYTGRPESVADVPIAQDRRINRRGALIVGGFVLVALVSYFPILMLSNSVVRRSALRQAHEIAEKGDTDLAIRHLEHYLEDWPDDLEALKEAATLRSENARTYDQISKAADLNYRVVRLDPYGKDRQDTRRKLVELWVRQSAAWRAYSIKQGFNISMATESRYQAAQSIARELTYGVKLGDKVMVPGVNTSESHRLLAQTLDASVLSGDDKYKEYQAEAIKEFTEALRLDPGDSISAERLVQHFLETIKDPAAAQLLMDDLVAAKPNSTDVRLARYRYYLTIKKFDLATVEMDAAVALAPDSAEIRYLAAQEAFRRRDLAAVQAHCNAIPAAARESPRVRMLLGMLEFSLGNNEKAIDHYRKGLAQASGNDQQLTFYLARSLIKLNRLSEAKPLVVQFQRLEGKEPTPIALFLTALYDQRAGHFSRAIANLKKAETKIPEGYKGELQLVLARCYQSLSEPNLAKMAYRSSITTTPWSTEARRELARLLLATNPQEALLEMERALTQTPNDFSLLYDAARLQLARQGALPAEERRWNRFEEILEKAEKIAPGEYSLRTLRSDYLIASGKVDIAIDSLYEAIKGPDRKNVDAWLNLANRLHELGRRDEALRVLEDAGKADAAGDHARIRITRAVILARSGKGQQARELLTRDRNLLPLVEQPDLCRALGELAREMGDRETARAAYLEWARLVPYSTDPGLGLMALGEIFGDDEASRLGIETLKAIDGDREPYGLAAQALEFLRPDPAHPGPPSRDRLEQAERILTQLQEVAPESMIGHLIRGHVLQYSDRLPEAAAEFRLAMEDGGSTRALVALLNILWKLKRFDEVSLLQKKYEYQSMQSNNKDSVASFYQVATKIALKNDDFNRAQYFASKIVDLFPESIEARTNLARALDALGRLGDAEATFLDLIKRHPNDAPAWVALATFQSLRGKPEDLSRTLEEIPKTYKGPLLDLLMGRCYWLARDSAKAADSYAAALKKSPDDPVTLREAADFYRAQNRADELYAVLRHASKQNLPWASQSLASRLSSSKNPAAWAEAWSIVEPGARTSSESPEDRFLRIAVLSRSPDPAQKEDAFNKLIALIKDLPVTHPLAIEARVRVGQAFLDSNRPAEAESFLAPIADQLARPNPMAVAMSAEALARSGKLEAASAMLDRLVAVEPKSPRTSAAKAWVLNARGKQAEAIAVIDQGVDQAISSPDGETAALALVGILRKFGGDGQSERIVAKVVARWPRHSCLLARLQSERKKYAEALASIRAALEAGEVGDSLQVASALMVVHRADPEFLKELDALGELARSKSPRSFEVLAYLADLRHLQDRFEEEVSLYREAAGLNPPSFFFLNNMAWTLSEGLGKHTEGLARIDEAIQRMGRIAPLLDTRGVILTHLGRFGEAIIDLETSSRSNPSATTYFHLARTYLKAGKTEEFRRYRDLARKGKLSLQDLDATDRENSQDVLLKNP